MTETAQHCLRCGSDERDVRRLEGDDWEGMRFYCRDPWHTALVPDPEPVLKCGHTESQHQRDWEAVQPTSPEPPRDPMRQGCQTKESKRAYADSWAKPAAAPTGAGEGSAPLTPTGELLLESVLAENAALRSQLEERTRELADEHSADAQIQEQYAALERDLATAREQTELWKEEFGKMVKIRDQFVSDLATAQARIASATTFLRRADATSMQNELYDLVDEARQALAEPPSGEK